MCDVSEYYLPPSPVLSRFREKRIEPRAGRRRSTRVWGLVAGTMRRVERQGMVVNMPRIALLLLLALDASYTYPLAVKSPRRVTSMLKSTRSYSSLLHLTEEHCYAFNAVHVSAAWMQLSRLRRGGKQNRGSTRASGKQQQQSAQLAEGNGGRASVWPTRLHHQLLPLAERTIHLAEGKKLSGRAIANVCYGSVASGMRSCKESAPLFRALADAVPRRLNECTPQAIANIAWAYATAGESCPELFDAMATNAAPRLDEFEAQHLSRTAWAYASSGEASPGLFKALAHAAEPRLDEFEAKHLSMTAWAFATVNRRSPALFDAIAAEATPRLSEFEPQAICNIAWAYATLGHPAPALFHKLAQVASPQLHRFTPQGLANLAYAFNGAGTQDGEHTALLRSIAAAAAPRLDEFSPQNLVNLVLPLVSAGYKDAAFFDALAVSASPRVATQFAEFPRGLSVLVSAYAQAGVSSPELFDEMAVWLEPQLDDLTPQAVVSIASAYATLTGHQRATKLFDAVAAVVAARLDEFSVAELGQLAMAFARASFSDRSYTLFAPQEEALPEGAITSASELENA